MTDQRAHELAHLAVILGFVLIVALATVTARLSLMRRRVRFAEVDQFTPATQAQIDCFLSRCRKAGREELGLIELARIRRMHGRSVKQGHLLWADARVMGRIPDGSEPPAFIPGDGVQEAQVRLGPVFTDSAIPSN